MEQTELDANLTTLAELLKTLTHLDVFNEHRYVPPATVLFVDEAGDSVTTDTLAESLRFLSDSNDVSSRMAAEILKEIVDVAKVALLRDGKLIPGQVRKLTNLGYTVSSVSFTTTGASNVKDRLLISTSVGVIVLLLNQGCVERLCKFTQYHERVTDAATNLRIKNEKPEATIIRFFKSIFGR